MSKLVINVERLQDVVKARMEGRDIDILCIGTPKVMGDAVGPLIGTMLSEYKFNNVKIIGTLIDPIHALNFYEALGERRDGALLVAIDASLSEFRVGNAEVKLGPLQPGAALHDRLPCVGDISIKCFVAKHTIQLITTPLCEIYALARRVTTALADALRCSD